jgi:hypothetical protein
MKGGRTNCSHFSIDRRCHPRFVVLSSVEVWSASSEAVMARLVSTLVWLSCWSTALPRVVHFSVILACPQRSQMGTISDRVASSSYAPNPINVQFIEYAG